MSSHSAAKFSPLQFYRPALGYMAQISARLGLATLDLCLSRHVPLKHQFNVDRTAASLLLHLHRKAAFLNGLSHAVLRIRIRTRIRRIRMCLGLLDPDPDPLFRGMDQRIRNRIRTHTKMSWIRTTGLMRSYGIIYSSTSLTWTGPLNFFY